jgi:hypothetical protein
LDEAVKAASCGRGGAAAEPCETAGSVERTGTSSLLAETDGLVALFGAERVAAAASFVAVSLAPARARGVGAGRVGVAAVDSVSGAAAAVRAEGARRRTGAGLAGGTLDAVSSVGATMGLRRRGVFGRSASSMRGSLAASEHRAPCARLC